MTARIAAGVLLVASLAVYLAVTLPLQSRAAAASEQYRKARDERRDARLRLAELERREAARTRATAALAAARGAPAGGVRDVRRGVVDLVNRSRLSGVRFGVRPGRPPATASVTLSAEGTFDDVVRLTADLARTGQGLVFDRVRLVARPPRVGLDLDAVGLGATP
jgi:hypothetical protein